MALRSKSSAFGFALPPATTGSAASLPSGVMSTRSFTTRLSEAAIEVGSFEQAFR